MEQAVNDPSSIQIELASIYQPIQHELDAVDDVLRRELRNPHGTVNALIQHAFRLGGKRLRPMLLLLAGKATGELTERHVTMAAVVEMIHSATLVHDDMLDGASVRRHLPTVHARWDMQSSVLVGDFLFTHAFYLASTTGDAAACQIIGAATNVVCEGELRQVQQRHNLDLSEDDYVEIAASKTGELCAACCELGAHFSLASAEVKRAAGAFGRNLGIAFQIADDVLDLLGDEATTGKTLGTDLDQNKLTLPAIHMLRTLAGAERTAAYDALQNGTARREDVDAWLSETGAIQYAQTRALHFADRAQSAAESFFPAEMIGQVRRMLQFVTSRCT